LLYTYPYAYLINMINLNKAKKKLFFKVLFTIKIIRLLRLLKKTGVIQTYTLLNSNKNRRYILIYLYYYKNISLTKNFRLITKPSKSYFISHKALRLLSKRTIGSIFILSTNQGLMTHHDALTRRLGGAIIGFFSI